jgi:hypothetical protein
LRKSWIALGVRIVGLLLVAVALGLCLRAVGVARWPLWHALSGSVILVLGAGWLLRLFREREAQELFRVMVQNIPKPEEVEAELHRARRAADQVSRDTTQQLAGVALLMAAASGLALAAWKPAPPADLRQVNIHFSDGAEEHGPGKPLNPIPNETTLRLDRDLEKDMSAFFRTQHSGGGTGLGAWGFGIILVFVIVAEVVLFLWAFQHRPSAVPLIGAADLAALVIKNADHLSRPGGSYFWWAVYILLGIGFLLAVAGIFQVFRGSKAGQPPNTADAEGSWWARFLKWRPEETKEESLLNVGVSALILAWSLLLLAQTPHVSEDQPKPSAPIASAIGDVIPLVGPTFEPGKSDVREPDMTRKGVDVLKKDVSERAKPGDVVLLIGSTDCTSFGKGNNELAQERATNVGNALGNVVSGVEIRTPRQLPQQNNCTGTEDLRAVHPFLIRLKGNEN